MTTFKRFFSKRQANEAINAPEKQPSLEYFAWLLSRNPSGGIPDITHSPEVPWVDDGLVSRIASSYKQSHKEFVPTTSPWDHSLFSIKAEVHNALLGDDLAEAARVLERPDQTTFFWGFDDIARAPPGELEPHDFVLRRLNKTLPLETLRGLWLMDALSNLAEAVGARRVTYPEMEPADVGALYANSRSADQILDDIDSALGIKLQFPNPFPNEQGLSTKRGIVGFRSLQAVYQAWRIGQIARGNKYFKVLEIGAGLGRTAYFAWLFGIRNYTIIDIPLTNAAQASFLGRTLGSSLIGLYGEASGAGIRIIPVTAVDQIAERYDLIVNVDSLTEMDQQTAESYWTFIKRNTSTFLSINHEINQHTVRSLYADDPDVTALRYPYWMRRGYIEELLTWQKTSPLK